MDARIIGSASELGPFEILNFFGHELSREWSKIDPSADVLTKLQGNRFVELREGGRSKKSEEPPADTVVEIKKRLDELGVSYGPDDKKADLVELLSLAEAAAAEAAAEAGAE